jgi:hypothetical protein
MADKALAPVRVAKNHRSLDAIAGAMNKLLESLPQDHDLLKVFEGVSVQNVSKVHWATFGKLFSIAMKDPVDHIEVARCKECGEEVEIVCANCHTNLSVPVPNATLQRNQIQALNKLSDKLLPNLSSITADVNIHQQIESYSDAIVMIITQFVPDSKKIEALNAFKNFVAGTVKRLDAEDAIEAEARVVDSGRDN